jgi:transcriptional regulator with XRE-family HTH domain
MITQIREAIRGSGLSLNELGKQCAVSQSQLSRFLLGQRTLTLPAAARVCEALGLRLVGPEQPGEPVPSAPEKRSRGRNDRSTQRRRP